MSLFSFMNIRVVGVYRAHEPIEQPGFIKHSEFMRIQMLLGHSSFSDFCPCSFDIHGVVTLRILPHKYALKVFDFQWCGTQKQEFLGN